MKNIIGNPARGNNFFPRVREVQKIIESLDNGNNLQITAPRRVGKTSILWHLLDNQVADHHYIYVDTESITNEQDFYKKLLQEILKHDEVAGSQKMVDAFKEKRNRFFKRLKSIKIFNTGIEFDHTEVAKDYAEEFKDFISGYVLTHRQVLVLLIDEFPITVENIREHHGAKEAIAFLQKNREIRLIPDLNGMIKFLYTGSIGLNQTVSNMNASATINDLNTIAVGPLTIEEATSFFKQLLLSASRRSDDADTQYLLDFIQWHIPFHIQLITQEIIDITAKDSIIDQAIIDTAIKNIINSKYHNHFDHYHGRLSKQFKNGQLLFTEEILRKIAEHGVITRIEIQDIAAKFNTIDSYRGVLETLMHDGYIHNNDNPKEYRFISPILKHWWEKFIC